MTAFCKPTLIIFDLDGTLIDSVFDLADGVDGMLAHFNKPASGVERVRGWVGNGSVKLVERAMAWADIPADELDEAHEVFLKKYANATGKTVEYEGVTEGLHRLMGAGLTLALCTNKPTQFLPKILDGMGWTNMFSCVIGGDSLPTKKPNPMPLLHICQTLHVDTSCAVMVGDSVNDIKAGQDASMSTLALTYGYNYGKPISDSNPDGVFDDFGALVEFILEQVHQTPPQAS